MPPGKKRKELGPKSSTTRKSTNPITRGAGKQTKDDSAAASSLSHATRFGLRSRPSAKSTQPFEDNPESILRKASKSRKARETVQAEEQPESPTHAHLDSLAKSLDSSLGEEYQRIEYEASHERSDEEIPPSLHDTDPEQIFYRKWGYLPPLGEEATAVIDAIIADPDMAKEYSRISPENKLFPMGLVYRNVFITETEGPDPYADHIKNLISKESFQETDGEKESHGKLWTLDQAKCKEGSNEALFQRTLMMSLIARHRLIYEKDASNPRCLDFSVEEVWTCPPMPTRAYRKDGKFLTQPKPDLAVCFCRRTVIADNLWNNMPRATKRLACYENISEIGGTRVFHFFTIEAKKAMLSADDTIGKRQSLNNASQALHNMFEFFREAGKEHEDIFFAKVRFISVVASTEGLTIRIHRATREPADGSDQGFIMPERPDYPLRFEHKEFSRIQKDNFDRKTVIETFEKILLGYGANELRLLLQNAAKAIMKKLNNDVEGMKLRESEDFYRYGQTTILPSSRKQTPATSQAATEVNMSFDMLRSGTTTEAQSQVESQFQSFSSSWKRPRDQSEDGRNARSTSQRNRKSKTH